MAENSWKRAWWWNQGADRILQTENQWDDMHEAKDYGNDYYFIRQLFEQNWTPQSTVID